MKYPFLYIFFLFVLTSCVTTGRNKFVTKNNLDQKLELAMRAHDIPKMQEAIAAGANVNAPNLLLECACRKGTQMKVSTCDYLMKNGASIDQVNAVAPDKSDSKGKPEYLGSYFREYIRQCRVDGFAYLINKGAKHDKISYVRYKEASKSSWIGKEAIHQITNDHLYNHVDKLLKIKFLVDEVGVNINAMYGKETALMLAAGERYNDNIIRYLLSRGAEQDHKTWNGKDWKDIYKDKKIFWAKQKAKREAREASYKSNDDWFGNLLAVGAVAGIASGSGLSLAQSAPVIAATAVDVVNDTGGSNLNKLKNSSPTVPSSPVKQSSKATKQATGKIINACPKGNWRASRDSASSIQCITGRPPTKNMNCEHLKLHVERDKLGMCQRTHKLGEIFYGSCECGVSKYKSPLCKMSFNYSCIARDKKSGTKGQVK